MRWFLKAEPYEVQNQAFNRGRDHFKWGHFLEQGLGKTAVCLADFLYFLELEVIDCLIVVAPNYLKSGWEAEAQLWEVGYPVYIWPKHIPIKDLRFHNDKPFILVINTEALLHAGGNYLIELMAKRKCMMAVDESSCIKNPNSQISKRVVALGYDAPVHRALSGTPMSQNVMDLWPQLRFCGAINGMNPYQFRNRFATTGGFKGKMITGSRNEEELREILASCSWRALKSEWLDLPDKIYPAPLEFEMNKAQKDAYGSMLSEFFVEIDKYDQGIENEFVFANFVVHQLAKLTQISRGYVKNDDIEEELVAPKDNPAIRVVKQALEHTQGKTLIFAHSKYSVRTLYEELTREGHTVSCLRGGLTTDEVRERKRFFNEDPECRIMVLQDTVGAKGHTLLGQAGADRCSTTIFYENTYSLETRLQAEDRNHRIGQDTGVVYLDLVGSSMDTKCISALKAKQSIVDAVVNYAKSCK